MANARLLRQRIEDADNKTSKNYATEYDAYASNVAAYNAGVAAALADKYNPVFLHDKTTGNYYPSEGPSKDHPDQLVFNKEVPVTVTDTLNTNTLLPNGETGMLAPWQLVRNPQTGQVEQHRLNAQGTYDNLGSTGVLPDIGDAPELKKFNPNLTNSDINELQNPGRDQAGLSMLAAKGIIGKSQLAGDSYSKGSVFNDPKDPNNLKQQGVLARTLGGQL